MIPLLTAAAVALGLFFDAGFPGWGHWVADAVVVACFLAAYRLATAAERFNLLACVVIATAGESFLCFVWGLYEYRYGNLPVFVPFGHALIFLSGCRLARLVPGWTWKLVAAAAAPAVVLLALTGKDTSGPLWFAVFLACLLPRRTRNLYGVMLALAYCAELSGTAVGSWWWFEGVPWLSLAQGNPPLCAGVFYCILDLLVLASGKLKRVRAPSAAPVLRP